ncbi:hypothetical protein Pyn_12830 [Prunus yedoensis var. nudiflora]|uniref:Uncharacterized protein n=1 Tax=Prunus yedoensis var. nudiflora TaxID=2094558 RepID=A0A314U9Z1_PRUYE|nr:hypothetical protein Pyn_12830 [Prunus yedoensis var. nudiflora]
METGSKADESEPEEPEDEEFLSNESEVEELIVSKAVELEVDESETDELKPGKLIETHVAPIVAEAMDVQFSWIV